jgi:hypothetical protein
MLRLFQGDGKKGVAWVPALRISAANPAAKAYSTCCSPRTGSMKPLGPSAINRLWKACQLSQALKQNVC